MSRVFVTRGYGVRRIWGIGFRFVLVPGVLWVPVNFFGGLAQGRKAHGGSEGPCFMPPLISLIGGGEGPSGDA